MTNRELAVLLAGFGAAGPTPCAVHAARPAVFFCAGCRRPACQGCARLGDGLLRCEACGTQGARRPLWRFIFTPMGASASAIAAIVLFSMAFEDSFRIEVPSATNYTFTVEPVGVKRAIGRLAQAHRLREAAADFEAHGEVARAARFRQMSLEAYCAFEQAYPADDPDVPGSFAMAASRLARAQTPADEEAVARDFPEEDAGILATIRGLRRRVEAGDGAAILPEVQKMESLLMRLAGSGMERVAKAMSKRGASSRRAVIDLFTGSELSVPAAQAEVAILLARLDEQAGRIEEARKRYETILFRYGKEPEAVRRLAGLKSPSHETIKIRPSKE